MDEDASIELGSVEQTLVDALRRKRDESTKANLEAEAASRTAKSKLERAEGLAAEEKAIEAALAQIRRVDDFKSNDSERPRRKARRTKSQMDEIKEEVRRQVSIEPLTSAEIFFKMVERGVVDDVRRDRDQVIRELRELASSSEIERSGDTFWDEPPRWLEPTATYEMNEEPF